MWMCKFTDTPVWSLFIRGKPSPFSPDHAYYTPLCQSWYTRANDLVALSGSGSFIILHSIGGGIMGQTIAYANEKAVSRITDKKKMTSRNVRSDFRQFLIRISSHACRKWTDRLTREFAPRITYFYYAAIFCYREREINRFALFACLLMVLFIALAANAKKRCEEFIWYQL